jgi:hypothetical protein
MPSLLHEGILGLVREKPAFAADLLRDVLHVPVPAFSSAPLAPSSSGQIGRQVVTNRTVCDRRWARGIPGLPLGHGIGFGLPVARGRYDFLRPFTVGPNQEVYKCQDFADPFQGQAVDIHRYDLAMSEGSHHMLLFYAPGATDGPVVDCPQGGFQQGPNTFGAQSPKASQTYLIRTA